MKASKSSASTDSTAPRPLRLHDAVSIIVGIVVGTAIFKSPTLVAQNCSSPWGVMGLWVGGGILSLLGAFCYAELTTTYPQSGGDYAYLSRAFGRWVGFLFGWGQLTVVLTASIASMAYVFADYSSQLWHVTPAQTVWIAVLAVIGLSVINTLGVAFGKATQNVLTVAKVVGILLLIGSAVFAPSQPMTADAVPSSSGSIGLAMVFVLYAYGGWNDAAFVAAEVENGRRNLPLALIGGITGITLIYVLVNWAYLSVLGFDTLRDTFTPAADVLEKTLGSVGAKVISVIIMISSLGAMNGTMLTGSRVYARLGADYHVLRWLGTWHKKRKTPVTAFIAQAVVILAMIMAVGTATGRDGIDWTLQRVSLAPIPWDDYFGGFETLVAASAPVFWAFFLLTGIAIVVLRMKDKQIERPFKVPLYPLPVIAFCGMSLYMLYSSAVYAKTLALFACLPLLLGIPLFLVERLVRRERS